MAGGSGGACCASLVGLGVVGLLLLEAAALRGVEWTELDNAVACTGQCKRLIS
jgi:hypothetical protein